MLILLACFDGGKSYSMLKKCYGYLRKLPGERTYSQFGEDAVLKFFLWEDVGQYLDVGAGDPIKGNNTWFFYKKGWSGILVEPLPGKSILLRRKRPRDTVLQLALLDEKKKIEFYEYESYELSTTSLDVVKELGINGIAPKTIHKIDATTLSNLDIFAKPLDPYVLSVDAEGVDFKIICGIDFVEFSPRVICCEIYPANKSDNKKMEELLTSKGYIRVAVCFLSIIWCHIDYLKTQGYVHLSDIEP